MGSISFLEDIEDRFNDELHLSDTLALRLRLRAYPRAASLLTAPPTSHDAPATDHRKNRTDKPTRTTVRGNAAAPKPPLRFEVCLVDGEQTRRLAQCRTEAAAFNTLKANIRRVLPPACLRIIEISTRRVVREMPGTRRSPKPPRKFEALVVPYRERLRSLRIAI